MSERDDLLERVAETLKEPVHIDPSLDARVMSEIDDLPLPGATESTTRTVFAWWRRPRTIRLSPLGGLAMAAGLAAVVFGASRMWMPRETLPSATSDQSIIQFVLVAPGAATVSLVGDFNDWNLSATPLVRGAGDGAGVWSVTVPLESGRYRYSFLVDGTTWLQDPNAVPTLEDEFGRPASVLTVGGA